MIFCWVIYRHPSDFPDHWVTRIWRDGRPDKIAALCDSLDEARRCVPPWSIKIERAECDDPVIYEMWL